MKVNRPTVQFQSINGHTQKNSMPSHATVLKGVDGNSVVFATINSDRAGLPSDKKGKKNRKKKFTKGVR